MLKEKVLQILENMQGEAISGEEIAKELSVSRNSVWKSVNSLKRDGYKIISQANRGYILSLENEIFSANRIKQLCNFDINVIMLDDATSTNDVAKELAIQGARESTVVIAKKQSNGRGRLGRSFISNEDNGLYMSIILRPQVSVSQSIDITLIGAVSALEAIESTSDRECSVKWVNDIYIKDKKVCGILTEASMNFESGCLDYAIVGIGINVIPPKNGFPEEISDIATSIYEKSAPKNYKSILCAQIIDRFLTHYKKITERGYLELYRERSNIIGKEVNVYRGNDVISGTAIDIDDNANLVVKTSDGIVRFNSGEARVRKNESKK